MKSPRELLLVWLKIGASAFGGGNVALGTIRQEFVERRGWMEEDEFARTWALCQASPGINLLCMAILVGRRLGGAAGAAVSLLGMTLPGAAITLALAAGFVGVSGSPSVQAAMRGVVPATAGLGLASVVRAGLPLLREGWDRKGAIRVATAALPTLGFVGLFAGAPPVGLLLGGAAAGAGAMVEDRAIGPLALFWVVLKASTLSTGGLGNAPILHADLVRTGLATERQFTSALAVGQLSPGPSGLWVVALGLLLGGLWGGLAALVAVALPPFAVLGVAALVARAGERPGVRGLVWGLGIAGAGVSSAVMLGLVRGEGLRVETVVIAAVAAILGFRTRVPAVLVLVGAAIVGLLWK